MTSPPKDGLLPVDAAARRLARNLLWTTASGALGTLEPGTGDPACSLVTLACDVDGSPILLLSALAAHRRALEHDPRCSLLLAATGSGDPLAHPRLAVSARALPVTRDAPAHGRLRARFLARQPKARLYVDFGDFAFFRLVVHGASLNGGFGRAHVLAPADLVATGLDADGLDAFAAAEPDCLAQANAAAPSPLPALLGQPAPGSSGWRMTGIDGFGFDAHDGQRPGRGWFDAPVLTPAQWRDRFATQVALALAADAGRPAGDG